MGRLLPAVRWEKQDFGIILIRFHFSLNRLNGLSKSRKDCSLIQSERLEYLTMAESNPATLTFAKVLLESMLTSSPDRSFDSELVKAMTLVSASLTPKPRLVTRLTVTPAMCNSLGTLHGGAICTLFDVCTTLALATARKWELAGVTRTLSTTCLVPVFPGEEIEIVGELVQIGKKLGK